MVMFCKYIVNDNNHNGILQYIYYWLIIKNGDIHNGSYTQ